MKFLMVAVDSRLGELWPSKTLRDYLLISSALEGLHELKNTNC